MDKKLCLKCRKMLSVELFKASSRCSDGYQTRCMACAAKIAAEAKKKYQENVLHRDEVLRKQRKKYHQDADFKKRKNRKRTETQKVRYHNDPEFKEKHNKKTVKNFMARYHKDPEFKKKHNRKTGVNFMARYRNDPKVRVDTNIASQIRASLADGKGGKSWEDVVGYSLEELMEHLENLFTDGMSWGNYGEWHIDHKVPRSWFAYESYEDPEFLACWCLANLKPMWGAENISKGNRWAD